MALVSVVWLGAVGAADDWLKLTAARRGGSRQGLTGLEKLLFQIGLAVLLAVFTYTMVGRSYRLTRSISHFSRVRKSRWADCFRDPERVGTGGVSNAVNLTDGLDGLAAGDDGDRQLHVHGAGADHREPAVGEYAAVHYIQASDQMAVLAGAMVERAWDSCGSTGNPARVFMGDTGSLAMGGLIGYIAIVIRQE